MTRRRWDTRPSRRSQRMTTPRHAWHRHHLDSRRWPDAQTRLHCEDGLHIPGTAPAGRPRRAWTRGAGTAEAVVVAEGAAVVVTVEVQAVIMFPAAVMAFAATLVALSGRVGHTSRGGR